MGTYLHPRGISEPLKLDQKLFEFNTAFFGWEIDGIVHIFRGCGVHSLRGGVTSNVSASWDCVRIHIPFFQRLWVKLAGVMRRLSILSERLGELSVATGCEWGWRRRLSHHQFWRWTHSPSKARESSMRSACINLKSWFRDRNAVFDIGVGRMVQGPTILSSDPFLLAREVDIPLAWRVVPTNGLVMGVDDSHHGGHPSGASTPLPSDHTYMSSSFPHLSRNPE
jgi:hypothetical protein